MYPRRAGVPAATSRRVTPARAALRPPTRGYLVIACWSDPDPLPRTPDRERHAPARLEVDEQCLATGGEGRAAACCRSFVPEDKPLGVGEASFAEGPAQEISRAVRPGIGWVLRTSAEGAARKQ